MSENGETGVEENSTLSASRTNILFQKVGVMQNSKLVCEPGKNSELRTQNSELNEAIYYRAVSSKDARFDGVFFVGVKSTGIYCRPVCPARTPSRKGCLFFHRAAEAEQSGFRACFRCRPELAPGHASVDANSNLVQAALALINVGYLNENSVDDLAEQLGVTSRHLRRTMNGELGLTPVALAQSRRLAMAKQLVQETSLTLTDIAFASGFSSVRRFNTAFRSQLGCSPSELRRAATDKASEDDTVVLRLDYRPPLAWDYMLSYLKDRVMAGIEHIEDNVYRRTVTWGNKTGWLCVSHDPKRPRLQVKLSLSLVEVVMPLLVRVRRMFDLDAHPTPIVEHLQQDPILQPIVSAHPGLRIPGAFEPFPLIVRIILGQRISVKAATTLCQRLIETFGAPVETPFPMLHTSFPTAETLASCELSALTDLGITKARSQTIQTLAQGIYEGTLCLDDSVDPAVLSGQLLALRGIGPWTVNYALMRVFGDPDVFPASDLGLRKALGDCTAKEAEKHAEAWRPWRSYASIYLWSSPG